MYFHKKKNVVGPLHELLKSIDEVFKYQNSDSYFTIIEEKTGSQITYFTESPGRTVMM